MALGLNYETSSGDIIPLIKFDAKAGRMFRVDRENGTNTPHDVTNGFKAVVDFENVEVGFINFATGGAPDFVLVPLGDPMPQKPSDGHKQGARVMLKLSKEAGGDIRELASCAKTFLRGLDELHGHYEAQKAANAGKLPIVALKSTIPVTTGEGARRSTNYQPVFEIVGWAARPADLIFKPKSKGRQIASPSTQPAQPPATGSTQVSAPAAAQPAAQPAAPQVASAQPAMADAEDFG